MLYPQLPFLDSQMDLLLFFRLHCMPSYLIASSPARCRRPPGNLDRG